jgi:hypothetical protein
MIPPAMPRLIIYEMKMQPEPEPIWQFTGSRISRCHRPPMERAQAEAISEPEGHDELIRRPCPR